jgi:hypothetical protein
MEYNNNKANLVFMTVRNIKETRHSALQTGLSVLQALAKAQIGDRQQSQLMSKF